MQNEYTIGSLFSGIGGIELGFEAHGFRTEWFVESDKYCQAILRKHYPNSTIYDDVKTVNFSTVPKVDILTGGFPCQDISNAGKRAGIEGSRSSLWKYYFKAIREIRPRIAFIENVAALTNRGLCVVLADIAEIGYDAEWYNLSASAVGAPHQRERLFILAYPNLHSNNRKERGIDDKKAAVENQNRASEHTPWLSSRASDGRVSDKGYEDVSNSDKERCKYGRPKARPRKKYIKGSCSRQEPNSTRGKQNWSTEPNVGRVANGIPNRVDRIRCLGNAVVPQVAEVFAIAIKERLNYYDGGDFNPLTEESLINVKRDSAESPKVASQPFV